MASALYPAGGRAAAFAPAGIGLALLVATVQIRMDDPWSVGVLLIVAAVPAAVLVLLGLAAATGEELAPAAATILLVAGLVLSAVAILRLGDVLAGDDITDDGGTLTWMLALFTALAAICARTARSKACLLIAALAAVALVLEAVNWIFDTENVDTFRALLAVSFAVLFLAGMTVSGRAGTILVGAAGVTVLAAGYLSNLFFIFGSATSGLGWGWELVMLVEGVALLTYAALRLEPGPAYVAFFALAFFVSSAAVSNIAGESGLVYEGDQLEREEPSLLGWPLALGIGTVLATLWALRDARRSA